TLLIVSAGEPTTTLALAQVQDAAALTAAQDELERARAALTASGRRPQPHHAPTWVGGANHAPPRRPQPPPAPAPPEPAGLTLRVALERGAKNPAAAVEAFDATRWLALATSAPWRPALYSAWASVDA